VRLIYFLSAFTVAVMDQSTKIMVQREVPLHSYITIVPGFFSISHVLNRGAAFSMLADVKSEYAPMGLIAFSLIILTLIVIFLWRIATTITLMGIALSFILGGALGNLTDRIMQGSVTDFLAFDFGTYHWPDFNLADSFIVIGSCLLVLDVILSKPKPQDSEAPAK
jgi:signal peptidase II